ncbi:MAG TPA: hypothetical protein VGY31_05265 [Terriglobia bacterium]|nr:hypothetical protein [Terriglobia bacterium]
MKRAVAVVLLMVLPSVAMAWDGGYKVMYDGGSLSGVKAGAGLRLYLNSDHVWIMKGTSELAGIPYSAVTGISYGQDVRRKLKKHYIGLTWVDGNNKGGLALRCSKSDYRGILTGLEGVTGKKAVDSEAMTAKN